MIRQFSAGGIVLRQVYTERSRSAQDGKWEVLVVKNTAIRDKKISFWGFPKGHLEKGEKSPDAALREIKEETGIEAKIISKVGQSSYIFTQDKNRIFKIVNIFLMEYLGGEGKPQQKEISEVEWLSPKKALEILSFENDRDLLKQAVELVKKNKARNKINT